MLLENVVWIKPTFYGKSILVLRNRWPIYGQIQIKKNKKMKFKNFFSFFKILHQHNSINLLWKNYHLTRKKVLVFMFLGHYV